MGKCFYLFIIYSDEIFVIDIGQSLILSIDYIHDIQ